VQRRTEPVTRSRADTAGVVRCFLAVPLAEPALGAAQRALAALRAELPDVRWTRPETLHVTLHFFGGIDERAAARAVDAVRPVAQSTPRFAMTLDRLGAFPDRGAPRVLWIGGPPSAELMALATVVRQALGEAGFEVETRPFRAHCTLGRPRDHWLPGKRQAWQLALERGLEPQSFTAERLVLYESMTGRGGSVYSERAVLPLGG